MKRFKKLGLKLPVLFSFDVFIIELNFGIKKIAFRFNTLILGVFSKFLSAKKVIPTDGYNS